MKSATIGAAPAIQAGCLAAVPQANPNVELPPEHVADLPFRKWLCPLCPPTETRRPGLELGLALEPPKMAARHRHPVRGICRNTHAAAGCSAEPVNHARMVAAKTKMQPSDGTRIPVKAPLRTDSSAEGCSRAKITIRSTAMAEPIMLPQWLRGIPPTANPPPAVPAVDRPEEQQRKPINPDNNSKCPLLARVPVLIQVLVLRVPNRSQPIQTRRLEPQDRLRVQRKAASRLVASLRYR